MIEIEKYQEKFKLRQRLKLDQERSYVQVAKRGNGENSIPWVV